MHPDCLIHVTTEKALDTIVAEGLRKMSYWAEPGKISDYYVETIIADEETPVEIVLPLSALEAFEMDIDKPGLEEPLTFPLGMSEDEVAEEWEAMEPTWQNSLALIGSCRCKSPIPAEVLLVHNPHLQAWLAPPVSTKPVRLR